MTYQVLARKWRRSASTTSSASRRSRGRCATRSRAAASRSRSSSPGRAASARRRPRASWRAALNCDQGPDGRSVRRVRRLRRDRRRGATWTCSRSTPPRTPASTTSARSSSPASAIAPVRDRYKIFIIDEVHQLSTPSFNALLKSIEEPPPHVVFMMATTELDKIPDTILSRSQVFEFKTIATRAIADQLRDDRDGRGDRRRRRRRSTLIARAGRRQHARRAERARPGASRSPARRITADDVATVLGLVGRDLLFDIVEAVADEDGAGGLRAGRPRGRAGLRPAARVPRAGAPRARPAGRRRRSVARSTTRRLPPRASASGSTALAARFSREDLLRAFDVLTEGRVRDPQRRRSRATTSRWRCCGGSTCASWCR